jgi:hypothetical protein
MFLVAVVNRPKNHYFSIFDVNSVTSCVKHHHSGDGMSDNKVDVDLSNDDDGDNPVTACVKHNHSGDGMLLQ